MQALLFHSITSGEFQSIEIPSRLQKQKTMGLTAPHPHPCSVQSAATKVLGWGRVLGRSPGPHRQGLVCSVVGERSNEGDGDPLENGGRDGDGTRKITVGAVG